FVIDAHAPGAAAHRFPKRDIQVAEETGIDVGFSHHVSSCRISALLRRHLPDKIPVPGDGDVGARRTIVWTVNLRYAVKLKFVPTGIDLVSYCHANVLFGLITSHKCHPND